METNTQSIFSLVSLYSFHFHHIPKYFFPTLINSSHIPCHIFNFCFSLCSYPNSKFHFSDIHVTPNTFHFLYSKFHIPSSMFPVPLPNFQIPNPKPVSHDSLMIFVVRCQDSFSPPNKTLEPH